MTSFNDGIESAVTTDQARRFLECAVRNWSRVSFDREGLEDFRIELERFRQKVLAEALKRPEPSEEERVDRVARALQECAFDFREPVYAYVDGEAQHRRDQEQPDNKDEIPAIESWKILARAALAAGRV